MAQRHALIEHEAFAAPAAFGLGNAFDVFQNAALEVVDLGETARQQIGAGLFTAIPPVQNIAILRCFAGSS